MVKKKPAPQVCAPEAQAKPAVPLPAVSTKPEVTNEMIISRIVGLGQRLDQAQAITSELLLRSTEAAAALKNSEVQMIKLSQDMAEARRLAQADAANGDGTLSLEDHFANLHVALNSLYSKMDQQPAFLTLLMVGITGAILALCVVAVTYSAIR